MIEFFRGLFSRDFMPHGMCYLWDPGVLWLNVLSDSIIAAAYYAIPFLLFYFNRKRRDVPFHWIFAAFGVFILACGTTHLMGAVTVWQPFYRVDGVIKAITAAASVMTFALMIPMMPTLIKLPKPSDLARVNQALEQEIGERRAAEAAVRAINEELEERVARRTAEQRELQEQLIQAQKMEAVGRLAGGVAHDFNNLLTVIVGYNEMLRDHLKGDITALEYAHEVLRAAERASNLTDQLLAFSRRQISVPRLVSLNVVVQNIEKMLHRIIGEDIELTLALGAGLSAVNVDPARIDQVMLNLAVNSRDAMPGGGKLIIETAEVQLPREFGGRHIGVEPGRYAMLAVSDTGCGMDATTRSHIFEPFFTTKEQGKGTGLGLSIVYGIVKQNGGEVFVYSEPGRGTTFRIYFPAVGEAAELREELEPETETSTASETILLVEDEEQVRKLTRTVLAGQGYRVLEASSGSEALQLIGDHPGQIDLLITDIVMPRMGGVDLAARVCAQRPGIRVLFMSGYAAGIIDQPALASGAAFLQKPFTQTELRNKVRDALV